MKRTELPAWLDRASPGTLGVFLGKTASPRKSGLFARHLCRFYPEVFTDPRSLAALDAADRYEAGEIDEQTYRAALSAADEAAFAREPDRYNWGDPPARTAAIAANIARAVARGYCLDLLPALRRIVAPSNSRHSTPRKQAARVLRLLFFEHFGDIRRPAALGLSWRTGVVVALAESIYRDRVFDRLPILADALEEAGCDHPDVLAHCRSDGPHARGCWVVDLVLGKG